MKAISEHEIGLWLSGRGIDALPYGRPPNYAVRYFQFPTPYRGVGWPAAVIRNLILAVQPFQEALLHIKDWPQYEPDEMAMIGQLRLAEGERRPLIDAPGHVFSSRELDHLIGLFVLAITYGWDAYLYFDHRVTLFSWEGEMIDVWCSSVFHHDAMKAVLEGHDVGVTSSN